MNNSALFDSYENAVHEAMKGREIVFIDNFDDIYAGWEINTGALSVVRFKFRMDNRRQVVIEKSFAVARELKTVVIWVGPLPEYYKDRIDNAFLQTFLRHWRQIGTNTITF